jgi:phosphoribosylanthranilate isomerase
MNSFSKIKLKICGMREAGNITAVAALKPDYLGFIFYPGSPRFVGADFVLPEGLSAEIKKVGVFVNEPVTQILKAAEKYKLHLIQLHGNEDPDLCQELRDHGLSVIKVFAIDDATDFEDTKQFAPFSDYFLFDTKGKYFGGNAKTFNWEVLRKYDQQKPFFLSGGLSEENIEGIGDLKEMNLHAADLNSGVEFSTAVKDVSKIMSVKNKLYSMSES